MGNDKAFLNTNKKHTYARIHRISGDENFSFDFSGMCIVFAEKGNTVISSNGKLSILPEDHFVLFCSDGLQYVIAPEKIECACTILEFFSTHDIKSNIAFEENVFYPLCIKEELRSFSDFLSICSPSGEVLKTESKIDCFLLDLNEKLFSKNLTPQIIGINGFSAKGIAQRECGFFHGRFCCRITPADFRKEIVCLKITIYPIWKLT